MLKPIKLRTFYEYDQFATKYRLTTIE